MQQPPRFSALKTNGRRAYERARNNEEFTLGSRPIVIDSLTLAENAGEDDFPRIEVRCSTGTYVRSLARDLASALGTWGHARRITRIAAGPFSLEQALDGSSLAAPLEDRLIPAGTMISSCARIKLAAPQMQRVKQGADIGLDLKDEGNGPLFAFDDNGAVAAVLTKKDNGAYHPAKVFL